MIDWTAAIEMLNPFVVKIATPRGTGTGFIISSSGKNNIFGIATASHVINQAHYWEEPIRVIHPSSGQSIVFRHHQRAVILEEPIDTAALVVETDLHIFPEVTLPLVPENMNLKLGHEVGWLGFPSVSPNNLCFFTGRTSCWIQDDSAYLIDGVAINGVSGGPVFHLGETAPVIVGVVSAYMANRATGETLPGLSVVRDVKQFHQIIKQFQSMEEAKKQETPPQQPPPDPKPTDEKQ